MNAATQEADAIEVYDTRHTLDNLDLNTMYIIRVLAVNSLGVGSPSDIVSVRTGHISVSPITDTPTERPWRGKNELISI